MMLIIGLLSSLLYHCVVTEANIKGTGLHESLLHHPEPQLEVEIGNVTYVFGLQNVDWYEATAACANISMQLLILDNKEKDDEISQWLRDNPTYDSWKWIGARREASDEIFYWSTSGAALDYTHWGPQQPQPPPTLPMCVNFSGNWEWWEDDNCDIFRLAYICENIP